MEESESKDYKCICGDSSCTIPFGYCHCGLCGLETTVAKYTIAKDRSIAGKPKLFAPYHHLRLFREPIGASEDPSILLLPLGRGQTAIIDSEDRDKVCDFLYCSHREDTNIYAMRSVPGEMREDGTTGRMKIVRLHWDILHKPPRGFVIDHINGNGLDNRKINLRECSLRRNSHNHKLSSRNKSGYAGVRFDEKRQIWIVTIGLNGKNKHLAVFRKSQKQKAIECRRAAENLYYGEFSPMRNLPATCDRDPSH